MSDKKIEKRQFKDSTGKWLTQSLFLEFGYNPDFAIYTIDEDDKEYKGNIYPSLKRLYLEAEDPLEYLFAKKHLGSWGQWQRMCANQWILKHIKEWRDELEILIRSKGVQKLMDLSEEDGNVMASKYLAEKGWDKGKVGRPSKKDQMREDKISQRLQDDFSADVIRLRDIN